MRGSTRSGPSEDQQPPLTWLGRRIPNRNETLACPVWRYSRLANSSPGQTKRPGGDGLDQAIRVARTRMAEAEGGPPGP